MLTFLKVLAGVLLVGIAVIMELQVFQRYVLNYSLSWPDELASIMLAVLTFIGGALGIRYDDHIGFTTLMERLNERWRLVVRAFSDLIALVFLGVILAFSIPLIIRTWRQTPITVPVPRGLIYLVMWIGVAAMCWYLIANSPVTRHLVVTL